MKVLRIAGVVATAILTAGCPASLSSVENPKNSVRATTNGDYQAVYACIEANIEQRIRDGKTLCEPRVRDIPAQKRARLWCEISMFLGPTNHVSKHDIYQDGETVVVIGYYGPSLFPEKLENSIRELWAGCL